MFKEIVDVIEVCDNKIKVRFTKKEMCSCCKLSDVCGMSKETLTLENNQLNLAVNDRVEIGIEEKKTLIASLIMFFTPALIFVSSLVFFRSHGELFSFSIALLAICIYYVSVKLMLRKNGKKFNLKILRKI